MDDKRNFRSHIEYLEKKIAKGAGLLWKLSNFLSPSALLTIYNAIIYPHLHYGILVWDVTYECDLNKLQILQNRAIRAIHRANSRQSVTLFYCDLKLLKVNDICSLELLNLYFNIILIDCLKFFATSLPTPFRPIPIIRSTSFNNFYFPKFKTSRLQRTYLHKAVKV